MSSYELLKLKDAEISYQNHPSSKFHR